MSTDRCDFYKLGSKPLIIEFSPLRFPKIIINYGTGDPLYVFKG